MNSKCISVRLVNRYSFAIVSNKDIPFTIASMPKTIATVNPRKLVVFKIDKQHKIILIDSVVTKIN